MQAVILCAGRGTRLQPLTDTKPKALTEICGVPMLVNALMVLAEHNISEVVIVVGYMKDEIINCCGNEFKGMKITYVYNDIYAETNNNYSLYLTKDYIREDTLLLECDLYYESNILDELMSNEADCSILVSRYNNETMDGTVVYTDNDANVLKMVLKSCQDIDPINELALKTVNIYKFKYEFWETKFIPQLEYYIFFHNKKSYYEKSLGALIYYRDSIIKAVEVSEDLWAEVDDLRDLEKAESKFGNH